MTMLQEKDAPGTYENHGPLYEVPGRGIKVSAYTLVDILISAIESGVHGIIYWCPKVRLRHRADEGYKKKAEDTVVIEKYEGEVWNEFICRNVAMGGTLTFYEQDENTLSFTLHTMTREKLLAGIAAWLEHHTNDGVYPLPDGEVEFNMDGPQADLIVQWALLKENRYG